MWKIYKFESKINGKCYIGITKQLIKNRLKLHYHDVTSGRGSLVHAAFNKHGLESFWFNVIGEAESLEEAYKKEMLAIRIFNSKSPNGYNLTVGGDGGSNPSQQTRHKMRLAQLGKKQSEETKEKRRISRLGYKPSQESIQKSANARRGVKRSSDFVEECRIRAKAQFASEDAKNKVRDAMIAKWKNPEYRAKMMAARSTMKGA